ncbi:hypothetical protein SEA_EVEPICKLES_43 [Arthrobacter phage EvePickles]|nr:hypothetical protein SEA_EVEPICKLES_43 [Arthrobacter phage EvePickles]
MTTLSMSNAKCTACQHPVIIPTELRDTVREIHTCEKVDA